MWEICCILFTAMGMAFDFFFTVIVTLGLYLILLNDGPNHNTVETMEYYYLQLKKGVKGKATGKAPLNSARGHALTKTYSQSYVFLLSQFAHAHCADFATSTTK